MEIKSAGGVFVFLKRPWPDVDWRAGRHGVVVMSLCATIFFLIYARYYFPGGAFHFTDWADQLVAGRSANPEMAQRDIGYPLLLVLGLYPFTHSFAGITLINAAFAFVIPLLVYGTIGSARPRLALLSAVAAILSAAPYVFMKMIHHDQAYLFFTLLAFYYGVLFLRQGSYRFVYFMAMAAIAASLTRPTGNLFFILAIGFFVVTTPKGWRHYVTCILIFAAISGAYKFHRQSAGLSDPKDSYTGRQIFFNPYVNSRELGIRIGPELGPATARLIASLRTGLEKNPVDSAVLKRWFETQGFPQDIIDRDFRGRDPNDLVEQVLAHPNYDYFELLCLFEPDDRVFRNAAIEILLQHPIYAMAYTLRNLGLFFATDGYGHTRFGAKDEGQVHTGIFFAPLFSNVVQADIPKPGIDELNRDPTEGLRWPGKLFSTWHPIYLNLLRAAAILSIVAVVGAAFAQRDVRLTCWFAALIAVYNGVIVSAFAEPFSRYQFAVQPELIICAAFGALVLWRLPRTYSYMFCGLVTLALQISARYPVCDGLWGCGLSMAKAVVWSAIWPVLWLVIWPAQWLINQVAPIWFG